MTEPLPPRLPTPAPSIQPPTRFVEHRLRSRRAVDRLARDETRLLARSLDILAADIPADARLAGLLDLLARTVGARRAAVAADDPQRRVAVAATDASDEPAAIALATWLDNATRRSRVERAAAGPATIVIAHRAAPAITDRGESSRTSGSPDRYAALPIPAARGVTLGFAFGHAIGADALAERMPPYLARHAAVALALVTESMGTERQLAELRAAEAERSRFVSTVAHELRTPLTGLGGYLDLIVDGQVADPAIQREFLERGQSIVASMTALIGDLLELSRLEAGSLELENEPFSVAESLSSVADSLLPIALERGARLETILPPKMRTALGDRRWVEQIVTNLAANALKYGADGGLVELAGRFEGSATLIAIRDEGPGIEPEDRQRIFEPFYRLSSHQRVTGTGLGLSIARDLARAMGGDLDVASQPGVGSSFVFVLPGLPAGAAHDVGATLEEALSFEADRLEVLGAVRSGERRTGSAAARRVVDGLGSNNPLSKSSHG